MRGFPTKILIATSDPKEIEELRKINLREEVKICDKTFFLVSWGCQRQHDDLVYEFELMEVVRVQGSN